MQKTTSLAVTKIARDAVDSLIDADCLGFMLSSSHFESYLTEQKGIPGVAGLSPSQAHQVHLAALELFKGLFIEEAKYTSPDALMLALDAKYLALHGSDCARQANQVEMAWKYRRICQI
jgi:hypothetical protein